MFIQGFSSDLLNLATARRDPIQTNQTNFKDSLLDAKAKANIVVVDLLEKAHHLEMRSCFGFV